VKSGKVLVTGSRGQLGRDLMSLLPDTCEVTGIDLEELDIRNKDRVLSFIGTLRPDIVIHAAAYTNVDGAESDREEAMLVNATGTRNIAIACRETDARLIYFSTDYVFNGEKRSPYTEEDTPGPKTVYGQSKLAGEKAIRDVLEDFVIVRISWLYGRHGGNFVKTMLRLGRRQLDESKSEKDVVPLKVVDDQIGNPTWTADVVRQTAGIIEDDFQGICHATSEGETSWYGFARDIFNIMRMPVLLASCTTEEFPRPAPRPRCSSLENGRLKSAGINRMRHYREAVAEFLEQYGKEIVT